VARALFLSDILREAIEGDLKVRLGLEEDRPGIMKRFLDREVVHNSFRDQLPVKGDEIDAHGG
jgi:hypothetical protein